MQQVNYVAVILIKSSCLNSYMYNKLIPATKSEKYNNE